MDEKKFRLEQFSHRNATNFSLSDTAWVPIGEMYNFIPLSKDEFEPFMRSGEVMIHKDEAFIYGIKVNEVKNKGETAPFEYAKPNIRRLLLNKQKVELVQKTYDNIFQEAARDQTFEIFVK